jgi:hypothetical protein
VSLSSETNLTAIAKAIANRRHWLFPHSSRLHAQAGEGKHNVWITWPDGHEQHVEFLSETEAKLWIKNKSEDWLKKHPKNKS